MTTAPRSQFEDLLDLANEDLSRFAAHRAQVAEVLVTMPRATAEKAILGAVLGTGVDGHSGTSLWLIDDAFLGYQSASDEEAMAAIVHGLGTNPRFREPGTNVAVSFARDGSGQPNKLVIIEVREAGDDIYANSKALLQARLYANAMAEQIPSVREVSYYAISDIGDESFADMKRTGFNSIFSFRDRVLYRDFLIGKSDDVPLHFFIMAPGSLFAMIQARFVR